MAALRSVSGTVDWCHICGLPIPNTIVSPFHPLFGTVDHVKPLAKGGCNKLSNKRAAHRFCNEKKGQRELIQVDREALHPIIREHLERVGIPWTKKMRGKANLRIQTSIHALNRATRPERKAASDHFRKAVHVWENEGGSTAWLEP